MPTTLTIAGAEIRALFREKTMYSITGVFLFMAPPCQHLSAGLYLQQQTRYTKLQSYIFTQTASLPFQKIPSLYPNTSKF